MAAPSGAASGKWNTVVGYIVNQAAAKTPPLANAGTAAVDAWLNAVWTNPAAENDRNDLREICVTFMEANDATSTTFPTALHKYLAV